MSWVSRLRLSGLCLRRLSLSRLSINAQRKVHGQRYESEHRKGSRQPNARRDTWVSMSSHDVVAHIKTIEFRIARRVYTNGRSRKPCRVNIYFVCSARVFWPEQERRPVVADGTVPSWCTLKTS